MTGVIEKLRMLEARFAGDGLSGIPIAGVEAKALTLPRMRRVELFRIEIDRDREIREANEEATRQTERDIADEGARRADRGQSIDGYAWDANTSKRHLAVCAKYVSAFKDEYGLRDVPEHKREVSLGDILAAIADRIRILADLVNRDYETSGLPDDAVVMRSQIAKAQRETWPLRKALADARLAYNRSGGAAGAMGAELEADVQAKHAALTEAEAYVGTLQRHAWELWALR